MFDALSIIKRFKERADNAEAALKIADAELKRASEELAGIQLRMADQAVLISITTENRANRFLFVRNGEPILVETFSQMSDDVPGWRKSLLERINNGG